MENFHINLRKITNRKELKSIRGGGGGVTPSPPSGTGCSNVKCCTDITESNCSECVSLSMSGAQCTGGNILVSC